MNCSMTNLERRPGRLAWLPATLFMVALALTLPRPAAAQDGAESVEIPMEVFRGSDFGDAFDTDEVERMDWGTITFSFPDCASAHVDYNSALDFGEGSISLIRLTSLVGVTCTN